MNTNFLDVYELLKNWCQNHNRTEGTINGPKDDENDALQPAKWGHFSHERNHLLNHCLNVPNFA